VVKESSELAHDLVNFIDNSPVSFFASKQIKDELLNSGYTQLFEGDRWSLKLKGKFFIERNLSSIIAFEIGEDYPWESGFKLVGAHTDSPLLMIKNDSLNISAGCVRINVEAYGGGINSTWLDRELSIAGRVTVKEGSGFITQLVDFKRPIAIIPNLAIHLNRDVNKGFEYNKQNHLSALLTTDITDDKITLKDVLSKEFNINKDDILDMNLFLYDNQPGSVNGLSNDFISVGKLDNLAMCHSILCGLKESKSNISTKVGVFFDNEEVGSRTMQGADSNFLSSTLDRIVYSLGGSFEDNLRSRYNSFLISADGAHAQHPNFSDKHDSFYAPKLNCGPVLKISSNFRYATTANSSSMFISMCEKNDIPYQKMVNRSDIPSGSTIGPMSSANLGIETVDIGNPMLAMHSIRETCGVLDHYYMTKLLTEFYSS